MDRMIEEFLDMDVSDQLVFLEESSFQGLNPQEKIEFIKTFLKFDPPPETIVSSLKKLFDLNYRDRYFFRKYLYHIEPMVAQASRELLGRCGEECKDEMSKLLEVIQGEGDTEKTRRIKTLIHNNQNFNEEVLVALLNVDDVKSRRLIIEEVVGLPNLDEKKLADSLNRSIWYVRASLIEILGRRLSPNLFDEIDFLIKDKNVDVKLNLIQALTRFDRERVRGYLLKLSNDPMIWVKREAEKALGKI